MHAGNRCCRTSDKFRASEPAPHYHFVVVHTLACGLGGADSGARTIISSWVAWAWLFHGNLRYCKPNFPSDSFLSPPQMRRRDLREMDATHLHEVLKQAGKNSQSGMKAPCSCISWAGNRPAYLLEQVKTAGAPVCWQAPEPTFRSFETAGTCWAVRGATWNVARCPAWHPQVIPFVHLASRRNSL